MKQLYGVDFNLIYCAVLLLQLMKTMNKQLANGNKLQTVSRLIVSINNRGDNVSLTLTTLHTFHTFNHNQQLFVCSGGFIVTERWNGTSLTFHRRVFSHLSHSGVFCLSELLVNVKVRRAELSHIIKIFQCVTVDLGGTEMVWTTSLCWHVNSSAVLSCSRLSH